MTLNGRYIKVTNEMEAKGEFMKMMSYKNCPILLSGDIDAGKSLFLDYFSNFLGEELFTCLKIPIHKDLSLGEFIRKLNEYTFLKYLDAGSEYHSRMVPKSGKKLVVMLDDFNLINENGELLEFMMTCSSEGYFLDQEINKKIQLGDIWFICANNSRI